MTSPGRCPTCGDGATRALARVGPVPVLCGSLWDSRREALATPTGELAMASCSRCGHVWNDAFDAALVEYDARYDNALDFSPTFRAYAEGLVHDLVQRLDLRGRRVVEIGSGKGEFLRLLCQAGDNVGIGFDPTYEGPDDDGDLTFVRALFTPGTAAPDVDFVCCRHVLEHVPDPLGFLVDVRRAVAGRPVPMYFEVPNAEFNFAESGPWDLIYPHVSYFNADSLRTVLTRAGFHVASLEPTFAGQFLAAHVVPVDADERPAALAPASDAKATSYGQELDRQLAEVARWRERINAISETRGTVALWGAGSKGVTFLSLVDPGRSIDVVVDANPRKWGRFLPGSGHAIAPPADVATRSVDSVLVMNPLYAEEIGRTIAEVGGNAEVVIV